MEQGLIEGQQAIDLFFDNKFAESREIAQKQLVFLALKQFIKYQLKSFCSCDRSIYHALGNGTFHYLRAVMTFDQEHIENASTVLSESVATIDR